MSFGRQLLKLPPLSFIISSNFFFLPGFIIGAETETSIIGSRREKELFFLPLFFAAAVHANIARNVAVVS